MFSEDVFANWSAETILAYCRQKYLDDITLDDIVCMLENTPDPPVGWIAFYENNTEPNSGLQLNCRRLIDEPVEGPYWCEQDIEEDLQTHRQDKRIAERTLAIDDAEMCEWLDDFIQKHKDVAALLYTSIK